MIIDNISFLDAINKIEDTNKPIESYASVTTLSMQIETIKMI